MLTSINKLPLDELFLKSSIAVWIYDLRTLKFLWTNHAAEALYGYSKEEFLQMNINEIGPEEEDYLIFIPDPDNKTMPSYKGPWKHKTKNGRIIYVEIDSSNIIMEDIKARVVFIKNVTDKKNAEDKLKESERKYYTLISNLPGVVYRCKNDSDWTMEFLSQGCQQLTGYTPDELIYNKKLSYNDIIIAEDRDYVFKSVANAIKDKRDFEITYRILTKDNQLKWVWEKGRGIFEGKDELISIEGVIDDITTIKNAEESLKEAKAKSEELNRLQSIFLSNMSHEFRTPMVGILGFAENLFNELDNPRLKEMCEIIIKSSTRLKDSLESILNFVNIEFQKIDIKYKEVDIASILVEAVKRHKEAGEKKGLKISLQLGNSSVISMLDENLFSRVIQSLIQNAIKYTEKGKITVSLDREENEEQLYALIKIRDTGIGIDKENMDKIFEPFRQGSEGLARKFEGTGLGLTISKRYIEYLNGKITVESEVGNGTTFTIKLPSIQKHLTKKIEETVINTESKHEDILPNVLFVENDIPTIGIIKLFLTDTCNVDYVTTGEKALDAVNEKKYSAILMDIDLGAGIDGVETTLRIRKISGYENVPIVAVTAYAMTGDKEKFLAAGCSHYLAKPFPKDKLIGLVKEITGTSD
jgi:PAS domain S-box-containing protein